MTRDLFDPRPSSPATPRRAGYSMALSVIVHAAVLSVAVVLPLMATDVLPAPDMVIVFQQPVDSPPPPAPPRVQQATTRLAPVSESAAPVDAPTGITPENGLVRESAEGSDVPATSDLGVIGGVPGGFAESLTREIAPPPPPARAPLPIGGDVRPPRKLHHVAPVYPDIARQARVEGIVVLSAVIGTGGDVTDVRVLRSIPLLDDAAVAAVRQWKYAPTLLNGVPIAIEMTVSLNFVLAR